MKKHIVEILLFLLLPSCIVMINENDYRGLNENQKKKIKQFDVNLLYGNNTYNDTLYLYELNPDDINIVTRNFRYTFVHLWRPFCTAESCQNVSFYQYLQNKYHNTGLKVLLVSETYDLEDIYKVVKNSDYRLPVFVLQDKYFGHKLRRNRIKLLEELNKTGMPETKTGFDDFFFKDTTLIYFGSNFTEKTIDSLISQ